MYLEVHVHRSRFHRKWSVERSVTQWNRQVETRRTIGQWDNVYIYIYMFDCCRLWCRHCLTLYCMCNSVGDVVCVCVCVCRLLSLYLQLSGGACCVDRVPALLAKTAILARKIRASLAPPPRLTPVCLEPPHHLYWIMLFKTSVPLSLGDTEDSFHQITKS